MLLILGLFAVLLVLALVVYPALLLLGMLGSVLLVVAKGLSTRPPAA